ncbi:gliding motility-associated C-terminal domain-containing protein, partial [Aquimarina litoralis]|uniref:T9SS type B sorting domain-containing protein n=1 Tax=Aquimarina litoralis TaxID=584605 RepID=UPI001C58C64A
RSAIAEYNGPSGFFGPGTEFLLELSDENGVFQDPPLLLDSFQISTALGASAELDFGPFPIPTDLRGENYSMRVRDSNSQVIGQTDNIPIYYFDTSQGVTLTGPNVNANNVALCDGDPVTLTASPAGFPAYIWTRDGVEIPGETSNILENVTQPGFYNVKIDFGFCNAFFNFDSANTNVFLLDTNNVFIVEQAAAPVEFCPEDVKILTCSINDPAYTYEWFLDGEAIADSNTAVYNLPQSNFAGDYTVMVTARDGCSIVTNPVEVINLGSDILTQPPPQMILLPTETITLEITTNAPAGSTIQWFENDTPIPGATGLSIDVTNVGAYRAEVLTNDVCMSTLVAQTEVFVAESFLPTVSQVIDCDDNTATLALQELLGITAGGLEIPLTEGQYSFFDFEWFRDGTSLGETDLSITVNGADENASYTIEATFRPTNDFAVAVSDPVMIEFLTDDVEIVSDPPFLPFGGEVTLSVPLSLLYTYEWFVEEGGDFVLIDGETTNMITVSEEGRYRVIITYQECVIEREITVGDEPGVSAVIPNVITPNGSPGVNDNWVLPDEFEASDIKVTIYSSNGKLDFEKSGGYNEDWPANSASGASELIYYYIITRNSAVVRKGTITVMR